ncbi:MAG TPA: zinc-dependent metalloprotease family protein [Pyrinomonadaceae bacterium]
MKTAFLILIVLLLLMISSLADNPAIQSSLAAGDTKVSTPKIVSAIQAATTDVVWRDVDPKTQAGLHIHQQQGPRSYRAMRLDTLAFRSLIQRAPLERQSSPVAKELVLSLPLPDGGFMRFHIENSPIMEESLARRYPDIKTYRGQGIDDPTATVRFDWTQFGFHAIILSARGTVFIQPDTFGDVNNYIVHSQQEVNGTFQCDVDSASQEAAAREYERVKKSPGIRPNVASGTNLITYRLAVAATAEYTQTYGAGTVAGGLAAVTTTMSFVNAIYERELAIRLVLIGTEDSIIFTDPATDGYTHEPVSLTTLLTENQTKLDAVIGSANYDIGHVFDGRSTGDSSFSWQGQASIGVVCVNGLKARGASIARSLNPDNPYQYYSVAHEMGHQFSATHTFNAANPGTLCAAQRNASTAYEPGTGSTIMGYRLNCGAENVNSTDHYFHINSLEQITTYVTMGNGSSCDVATPNGNTIPTVTTPASFTIPRETPFALTATASDADGDSLTYCWEEFDLGPASPPNTDDGARPIFRSYAPDPSPTRTFPRGANQGFNVIPFEFLPTTTRTMRFRVTVRDNRANGGGVNSADTQLNVRADAGPFEVTNPSAAVVWTAGTTQTVTWNVANTNNAPVSCTAVRITLSTDAGLTFPTILANNTPNDGSEMVTIPGTPFPNAIVKVEAVGNVFFDVSGIFTINGPANTIPTITSFNPTTGPAGTSVTIDGTNFITPSAVAFNGTAASFVVNSTTQIVATVPNGVTTGPITVTTPSGTATSATNFVAPSYVVSGRITDAGNNPIPNVDVSFRKNFQGTITTSSTTTDAQGNYSSGNVGCQNNVLVTPSKLGLTFTPLAKSFVSGSCLNGTDTADFSGAPNGQNSFQFSSSTYNVAEDGTSATVTVTRTGDTSGTATVDYTTTDTDNFTVNCTTIAGNAFARCDFATSVDTLKFAPGETSKNFVIPIINDVWAEGNETFGVMLSNAQGATLGSPATATVTITDNETVNGTINPYFGTTFFVRQHYLDFLSREPEVGEPWSGILNGCSDVNNNPSCDRLFVSGAIFGSPEFQLKGYYNYRFYKLGFNRLPLYLEIVVDMRKVTGTTQQDTFARRAQFANDFVQRLEFKNLYDGLNNTTYVNTLMARYSLNAITTKDPNNPETGGTVTLTTTDLINALNASTWTRAQVLRAIVESENVFTAEFNQGFVAFQYYGYLRRIPDSGGYNAWLTYMNAHPTDFRTMVNGFMNSDEYRKRFGPNPDNP